MASPRACWGNKLALCTPRFQMTPAAMPQMAPICMLGFEGRPWAPLSLLTTTVSTGATSATPV